MASSLLTDWKDPGSISTSALDLFFSGELFLGTYGLAVSVFQSPLLMICPVLCTLLTRTGEAIQLYLCLIGPWKPPPFQGTCLYHGVKKK